jgi:hypothetical protein
LYPADYIDDDAYDDEDDDTINEYAKDLALEDDDLDEETLMRRHPFIADPLDDRYCEMCGWVRDEHLIRNEHNERSIVIRKDDR